MDWSRRKRSSKRTSDLHLLTYLPALGYADHRSRSTGWRICCGDLEKAAEWCASYPSSTKRKRCSTTHWDCLALLLPCPLGAVATSEPGTTAGHANRQKGRERQPWHK